MVYGLQTRKLKAGRVISTTELQNKIHKEPHNYFFFNHFPLVAVEK